MNKSQPRISVWFFAAAAIFFARAFTYATWVARGPEVLKLLAINTFQMGLLSVLYPLGGLLGITFANQIANRFGTRKFSLLSYWLFCAGFAALGLGVQHRSIPIAATALLTMGLPAAWVDFIGNFEGTLVDKASPKSLFSTIHGLFGLGMLLGAALASLLSGHKISIQTNYIGVAIAMVLLSTWASLSLPKHPKVAVDKSVVATQKLMNRKSWGERRSRTIAVIGFTFVLTEASSGTWVPIALKQSGFSTSRAAFALSIFWIIATSSRLLGGLVIDRLGRYKTVLFSCLIAALGIAIFALQNQLHLPYLGLILWGMGMAVGFPMSVASMGDEPAMASARINMIITIVYIASIFAGPSLGAVGQAFGINVAFLIPISLLLVSALLSKATKPLVAA